jgi:hypothetical protein
MKAVKSERHAPGRVRRVKDDFKRARCGLLVAQKLSFFFR